MTPLHFLILTLATFRLAILLAEDAGPWNAFQRFRQFLSREAQKSTAVRKSEIAKGVKCPRCTSLQLSFPIALYAYFHGQFPDWLTACGDSFLLACALSGAGILWNRVPKAP